MNTKVRYVLSQGQTRQHHCHWPGCEAQVPPARWGCRAHWYQLPQDLRNRIWATFRPGQEVNATPSRAYVEVARQAQEWIAAHLAAQQADGATANSADPEPEASAPAQPAQMGLFD